MKTLKIFPSHLEIRDAEFPAETSFCAVKLSEAQAMSFDSSKFRSIDDLIAAYGAENVLKDEEFYSGYIAVAHWFVRIEIVRMVGIVKKIDPKEANRIWNTSFAKIVREGRGWEVLMPTDQSMSVGGFRYVWTFNDCRFASMITKSQEAGYYEGVDAQAMDKTLKQKLVDALLSSAKEVELTDCEDMVLRQYLGSYYWQFFAEVN